MKLFKAGLVAGLIGLAALTACGDDDGGNATEPAGLKRFCELGDELDDTSQVLEEIDESSSVEDVQRVLAEFAEDNRELFDESIEVAPDEIKAEVENVVSAFRKAGDGDLQALADATGSTDAIDEFEDNNCD